MGGRGRMKTTSSMAKPTVKPSKVTPTVVMPTTPTTGGSEVVMPDAESLTAGGSEVVMPDAESLTAGGSEVVMPDT